MLTRIRICHATIVLMALLVVMTGGCGDDGSDTAESRAPGIR